MSVRVYAWNDSAPTGRIFVKFRIWVFFGRLSGKIQALLKAYKINDYFTRRQIYILIISRSVLLRMKKFQTKVVEKIRTRILGSITIFFSENRAVYEIMWKNIKEPSRPQMTIWRMRIAFHITKAAHTPSIYWCAHKSLARPGRKQAAPVKNVMGRGMD